MKADVHNIEDLATKLSNIPPTFLRDFLSPEEEHTLFLNDLEEEFFFSAICMFSQRKLRTTYKVLARTSSLSSQNSRVPFTYGQVRPASSDKLKVSLISILKPLFRLSVQFKQSA